jgi:4-hydroxy-tetrahydrodipicolinate synthase
MTDWSGVGTALVTPFTTAGAVDDRALRALVDRQVRGGVHFVVPCGTTGETPTLSRAEREAVVRITVEACAGKIPVLAGVGGYDTAEVAELAHATEALGVQGLLSVTPYYNKPTQEGLYQHYRAIAARTSLPIIVYNVPGRTGCNVEPRTLARLAAIPNIVGVKEASGNMQQMCEVCRVVPDDFWVLCGDDALALPLMAVGGRGVISVASNLVPDRMARLVNAALAGDFAAARAEHQALLPLMLVNFIESNPIPVKAALAMLGLCEAVYRLPMVPPSESSAQKIRQTLVDAGLTPLA